MKIAILGAGGLGGYLAAKLTTAGEPVALIARGRQLAAIREHGLRLIEADGTLETRPARLTDDMAEIGPQDVIIVTTKAHQLAAALEQIAPAVGPETRVVTVQNGVDAPDKAVAAFGRERVLIGVARIFSNITGPGEITRYGANRSFTIGTIDGDQEGGGVPELRAVLARAGVDVPDCPDVTVDLWRKFMLFNAVSSLTAATRARLGELRPHAPTMALARRLMTEVFELARAEGIALPEGAVDKVWAMFETAPDAARASTAHDLESGLPLEIDHICGWVARRGRALGVDVTASETLAALLEPWKLGAPH